MNPFLGSDGGFLLVHKPVGWSSFDLVKKVKKSLLKTFCLLHGTTFRKNIKVGHAGTLDPLAEGLMLICYGCQTKYIHQWMVADKTYEGIFEVGKTTPSFDMEHEPDGFYPVDHISEELVRQTAARFIGEQLQKPPLFSALKTSGKRAYELARQGKDHELSPRPIVIHSFEILGFHLPEIHFRIRCSKGTYVRALARDFGAALESGAYLKYLCRTAIGPFQLMDAWKVRELDEKILNSFEKTP